MKKSLEEDNEKTYNDSLQQAAWEKVLENTTVKKYPKKKVQKIEDSLISQYKSVAEAYGMSYDDLISQQMGTTVEKFEKQVTKVAKNSVKQTLATEAIADKENIKLDDDTYKTELKKMADDYGYDSVKALKIDGAEATAENIENGSYKVSRPFNIAVKKDLNNKVAKDFMSFIMSTEGQKVVADEKYIAVADVKDYAGTKPSGSCVVGGSSSVSPLMEKLIEAYKAVNPNASIELQTSDSTTGMTSTIEGSYDIGMASRELKEEEAAELEPTVIATDGIAVVVNNANPLDELSADQVKDIYVGNVSTWDEITK